MKKAIYQTLDNYLSKKTSRRDFIQAVTAMGFTSMAAESLLASAQLDMGSADESGPSQPRMVEGSAGSLIVEQLKAAGVKYIFHTNTSGLESMTDAVDTNEMQVIMVTHEDRRYPQLKGTLWPVVSWDSLWEVRWVSGIRSVICTTPGRTGHR